jgi:hypothetical protein
MNCICFQPEFLASAANRFKIQYSLESVAEFGVRQPPQKSCGPVFDSATFPANGAKQATIDPASRRFRPAV